MKGRWKIVVLIAMSISLFSCFDTDLIDPDKLDSDNIIWKPNMITPVMNVDVTLGDVLAGAVKDQTVVEEDGRYVIQYDEKNITTVQLKNILKFPISTPPVSATKINLPPMLLALNNFDARKGGASGELLEIGKANATLIIDTGNNSTLKLERLLANFFLNLNISPLGFKYKIELELGNADSKIYKEQTVEQFGTIQPIKFDKNDVLTFDKNNRNELAVGITLSLIRDDYLVKLSSLSPISIDFSLGNFTVEKAIGDFGNMSVYIPSGKFEVDMGELNDVSGFKFTKPYIKLLIENHNIGIGMNLDFNFIARKDGMEDISLKNGYTPKFNLYGPEKVQDPGAFKPSEILFDEGDDQDKPNTNIVPFMNSFPFKEVAYNGTLSLIPHQNSLGDNISGFVCTDGEIRLSARLVIPMEFSTDKDGLTYTQHLKDQSLGVDEDMKKRMKLAKFIFKAKNGWPVGVEFKDIIFKDEKNIELARINGKLLTSPTVNSDGTVAPLDEKSKYVTHEILLSDEVISILDKVKNIDLVMNLKVGGENGTPAKFTSSERLNLIMGIQAKLDLSNPTTISK